MGRLPMFACALPALLFLGCSNNKVSPDAAPDRKKIWLDGIYIVPEVGPDWRAWPADGAEVTCDPTTIGHFCSSSGDCDTKKGMVCLLTSASASTGICTCNCQPEDPKTPLVEDSCPEAASGKNKCVSIQLSSGDKNSFCMLTCKPKLGASECPASVACDPLSAPNFGIAQPICAYAGCTKPEDCPVSTSTVCSMVAKDCPTGETCMPVLSGRDEGRCQRPGKCDLASGLCDVHDLGKATAAVGDPCQSDLDCAGNMRCLAEIDEAKYYKRTGETCTKDGECCSRTCDPATHTCTTGLCTLLRRHGYCIIAGCEYADTLTIRACPAGSACNLRYYTGYCQKTCDMTKAEDCRGIPDDLFGDYDCRRWGNLAGYMTTDVPVCDFGTQLHCSFFAQSTFDCSKLGADAANSTHMRCQSLDGKDALGGAHDPLGFCLDDTSSGPGFRSPQPVP